MIRLPLLFILLAFPAFAQDATTKVDFGPLVANVVWPLLSAVLLAIGAWGVQKLSAWLGIKNNEVLQNTVESAMKNGLAYAQSKVGDVPLTVDVKNQIVATAANYAIKHVPDAMAKLGVGQDVLLEKLEARLSLNTTPPEKSVAVPTPPAAT